MSDRRPPPPPIDGPEEDELLVEVEAPRSAGRRRLTGATLEERYAIEGELSRGGMGVVYAAQHLRLGREVVIKVLFRESHFVGARGDEALQRFEVEARMAAQIKHPNVVRILDLGRLDNGDPYLVMERLHGEDLDDFLARRPTAGIDEVGHWLRPIAHALDSLHAQEILHRDIKPANIFMHRGPTGPVPKLIDFGLARLEGEEDRITEEGRVVGTPHYVAPEVAEGAPATVASDLYALACVAFEMLTAVAPFDGHDALRILTRKVTRPAPRLSDVAQRHFPEPLEAAMARALSREPTDRPWTAKELIDGICGASRSSLPAGASLSMTTVRPERAKREPSSDDLPAVPRDAPVPSEHTTGRRITPARAQLVEAGISEDGEVRSGVVDRRAVQLPPADDARDESENGS